MTRAEFRARVLRRDRFRCLVCREPADDAHHIIDRHCIRDGGSVPENGISLCDPHHDCAEQWNATGAGDNQYAAWCLFRLIGSSELIAREAAGERLGGPWPGNRPFRDLALQCVTRPDYLPTRITLAAHLKAERPIDAETLSDPAGRFEATAAGDVFFRSGLRRVYLMTTHLGCYVCLKQKSLISDLGHWYCERHCR